MEMIIPRDKYTHLPSTKTIRLLEPYNTWTAERIKLIRNLTKQLLIYDSSDPRRQTSLLTHSIQPYDIKIVNGVLSYITTAGMSSDDDIQIVIDTEVVTSTGGGGGASSQTITVSPINVLYQQSIAASGTLDTVELSTINCTKLNVYIANIGTSTNVEVTVKGSPTPDLSLFKIIGDKIKLLAGDSNGPVIGENEIPGHLWFSIANKDTTNSAIITITVERYIGSYTQTNTTSFSGEVVASGSPVISSDVDTTAARRVNIYCSQIGTSTNATYDIYGKSSQSPNIAKKIATCTLGASPDPWGCGLLQEVIPGSIYVKITNFDAVHTAIATVLVESFT